MNAKKTFLESQHAKTFADMSATPAFGAALDYAMLELMDEMNTNSSLEKLAGVVRFRAILEELALKVEIPKPVKGPTLDYSVYERKRHH